MQLLKSQTAKTYLEKNFEKSSNLLNDLGSQTLEMTIKNINRFLKDESIKT